MEGDGGGGRTKPARNKKTVGCKMTQRKSACTCVCSHYRYHDMSTDYTQIQHGRTNCRLTDQSFKGDPLEMTIQLLSHHDNILPVSENQSHARLRLPVLTQEGLLVASKSASIAKSKVNKADGYIGSLAAVMSHFEKTKTNFLDFAVSSMLIWQIKKKGKSHFDVSAAIFLRLEPPYFNACKDKSCDSKKALFGLESYINISDHGLFSECNDS